MCVWGGGGGGGGEREGGGWGSIHIWILEDKLRHTAGRVFGAKIGQNHLGNKKLPK